MDSAETIAAVCTEVGQIKALMKARGAVSYIDEFMSPAPQNVDWASLVEIALCQHPAISIPAVREVAALEARLHGIDGGVHGIIGHAMRLAATGHVLEAGEVMEGFANAALDAFAAHLAQNIVNARNRFTVAAPRPATVHLHGAVVVDQTPVYLTKQAV